MKIFQIGTIIGVTGNNGKRSVADLFYQIPYFSCCFNRNNQLLELLNPILRLQIQFHFIKNDIKEKKNQQRDIEASSHGLIKKRMHHIQFKGAIFTNFSQDHLDYHKNMKSYLNAKFLLFKEIFEKRVY